MNSILSIFDDVSFFRRDKIDSFLLFETRKKNDFHGRSIVIWKVKLSEHVTYKLEKEPINKSGLKTKLSHFSSLKVIENDFIKWILIQNY